MSEGIGDQALAGRLAGRDVFCDRQGLFGQFSCGDQVDLDRPEALLAEALAQGSSVPLSDRRGPPGRVSRQAFAQQFAPKRPALFGLSAAAKWRASGERFLAIDAYFELGAVLLLQGRGGLLPDLAARLLEMSKPGPLPTGATAKFHIFAALMRKGAGHPGAFMSLVRDCAATGRCDGSWKGPTRNRLRANAAEPSKELDPVKPETLKLRLVLDLDVVRGSRWRELSPFRESVLCHFADPALRANLAALAEALADQLLELEVEPGNLGEPWARVHLRALVEDLRHSREGLNEVVANVEEDESLADRQRLDQVATELIRSFDCELPKVEELLGRRRRCVLRGEGAGKLAGKRFGRSEASTAPFSSISSRRNPSLLLTDQGNSDADSWQ